MAADRIEVTHDAALGGRLRLTQPKRGHRFGHDAILLAAAVPAKSGDRVVDLGAGIGAAGLAVATRVPGIDVTLVEIEPALVALASGNIADNGFSESACAVALDVTASEAEFNAAGLRAGQFDHVMMNPPFNDTTLQASPDALRRRAHSSTEITLPMWIACAGRLLRDGGTLTLIWRAERLDDACAALTGLGATCVLPIHSVAGELAIRVICRTAKGAGGDLVKLPGFDLNDADKQETAPARAVLRDAMPLPVAR